MNTTTITHRFDGWDSTYDIATGDVEVFGLTTAEALGFLFDHGIGTVSGRGLLRIARANGTATV